MRAVLVVLGGMFAVAVVGAAVLALLAFSGTGTSPSGPGTPIDRAIAASRASADAPADFRTRSALPSCGDVVLSRGGVIPAARIACLTASSGRGHELVVASPTTEGDPVVRYFRVGAGIDGVEVFEDDTADRAGGGWTRHVCTSGRIDQFGRCA